MTDIQIISVVVYLVIGAAAYYAFKIQAHEVGVLIEQYKDAVGLVLVSFGWPWLLPIVWWQRRARR